MKTNLLLSLFLLATFTLPAQDKNFDLSRYKTPEYKRHELTSTFSLSGSHSTFEQQEASGNLWLDAVDFEKSQFHTAAELQYQFNFNSRKKVTFISATLTPNYQSQKDIEGPNTTKSTDAQLHLEFSGNQDYYLQEDKFFLTVAPSIFYSTHKDKLTSNSNTNKTTNNNYILQLGLGGGYGRIEPISDYWQSYYILQSLEKDGLLNRKLTDDDILEFAQTATKLKNKRFFDYRIRKIAELEALDSLLHKQDLVTESTISYFTTMNDYWSFASVPDRYAGRKLTATVSPHYSHNMQKNNDTDQWENDLTLLIAQLNYRCVRPINLYWDRIFNLNLSEKIRLSDEDLGYPSNTLNLSASIGWNYTPNFRTIARFGLGYYGIEEPKYSATEEEQKYWKNTLALNGSISYYVSPQLQINGQLQAYYSDKPMRTSYLTQDNSIRLSLNLGFSYAIF